MLICLSKCAALLPLQWLHRLGAGFGRIALILSGGFRDKSVYNLKTAGLFDPALLRRSAAHAGRAVFETPLIWWGSAGRLDALIQLDGRSVLEQAQAVGRGVIVLTPHLGSFEVAARAVSRVAPITVLYKPPRLPWVRRWVEAGRSAPEVRPVAATAAGVRGLLRALKRGEFIGILPDQVPSAGEGVWAPFLGRQAYTMTLPARLAELTGAPVVLAYGERLADGRGWRVQLELFTDSPTPAAMNQAMEHIIRKLPAQYFWGYNRYKSPPGSRIAAGASGAASLGPAPGVVSDGGVD